jgi:hypothetical protein
LLLIACRGLPIRLSERRLEMAEQYRDAAEVASLLGGHRSGEGWLCRCPVPGHGRGRGDLNPSLSVVDGDRRLLVHCFAGCDARDVFAALGARGHTQGYEMPSMVRSSVTPHERNEWGMPLWHASQDVHGSVAETYLRKRGITLELPPCIRACAWTTPSGTKTPAMIVGVEREQQGIVAVQVTILTADGRKADIDKPRRISSRLGDGAVRLAKPSAELGIAEGVETALSAMQLTGISCWASLGANRMHNVTVPLGVRVVHIFADDGEPGRLAAERTADQQTRLGRMVKIHHPPHGYSDFNEMTRMAA